MVHFVLVLVSLSRLQLTGSDFICHRQLRVFDTYCKWQRKAVMPAYNNPNNPATLLGDCMTDCWKSGVAAYAVKASYVTSNSTTKYSPIRNLIHPRKRRTHSPRICADSLFPVVVDRPAIRPQCYGFCSRDGSCDNDICVEQLKEAYRSSL